MTITNLETVTAIEETIEETIETEATLTTVTVATTTIGETMTILAILGSSEERASDSPGQEDNSYGSPTDDTQSSDSSSQEGSHNDNTEIMERRII